MIVGVMKRLEGRIVVEERMYQGKYDRDRYIKLWSTYEETTAIQFDLRGRPAVRYEGYDPMPGGIKRAKGLPK